ncbi:MAG: InlB B-repeat-containing protein [Erysipelotrichaceae bacterium]|nr:InlB B-repeat-containing protein [Erysipelotrichaceae bacterium]
MKKGKKLVTVFLTVLLLIHNIPFAVYAEEDVKEIVENENSAEQNITDTVELSNENVEEKKEEEKKETEQIAQVEKLEEAVQLENNIEENKSSETLKEEVKEEEALEEVEEEEIVEVVEKKDKIKVTVNFTNILKADGSIISSTESNTLSKGVTWTFTAKKLDNKVVSKNFSYNGNKYAYSGKWIYADGSEVSSPLSYSYDDFADDTTITLSPVYEITEPAHLVVRLIDNISTGSGAAANIDTFTSYSKTFKNPASQPHYSFLYWQDASTGNTYVAKDKYTITAKEIGEGATKEVNFYAVWQPSLTVNYYNENGKKLTSKEVYTDLDLYSYTPAAASGKTFAGWAYEKGSSEIIARDTKLNAPALTTEKVSQTVYNVYACYETTYAIEHYVEELNGSYSLKQSESGKAIIGSSVNANANTYEGFHLNSSLSNDNGIVKEGLVLKLYYDRNEHSVSYEYTNTVSGATALPQIASYKYGQQVKVAAKAQAKGYTFLGWDHEDFTMGDADIVIKGSWNINSHKVSYAYTGEVPANAPALPETKEYDFNSEVAIAAAPELKGYSFSGWDHETFTMPDEAVAISGYFTINSYNVSYEYEGEVPENAPKAPEAKDYKFGSDVTIADAPTMEGYTFSGWDHENFTMDAENVVIKGHWTINTHKVSYVYAEGSPANAPALPEMKEYDFNEMVEVADAPELKGYTFLGWSEEDFQMPDQDVEIIGSWKINSYKVTYEYEEGSPANAPALPEAKEYDFNSEVAIAAAPEMEGYTFSGWDHENFIMDAEDVIIRGSWTINSHKVSYEYNGEVPENAPELPESKEYDYNEAVEIAKIDNIKGYTFLGWNKEDFQMPDEDVTISGSWIINTHEVRYEYEGDVPANAPAAPEAKDYEFNSEVAIAEAPELKGYTFSGWDHENFTMDDEDVVIKGSFKINSYNVSYEYEGEVPENAPKLPEAKDYEFGSEIVIEDAAELKGYTFSGWDHENFILDDEDVVIKGSFSINSYKVRYEYEGEIPEGASELPSEEEYEFASMVKIAEEATAEGYTFSGWDHEDFTMDAEDVVIKGSFTINRYTVTWKNYDGSDLEIDEEVAYGETPSFDGLTPERKADGRYTYRFKEWTPEIEDVKADATYTAVYEAIAIPEEEDVSASQPEPEAPAKPAAPTSPTVSTPEEVEEPEEIIAEAPTVIAEDVSNLVYIADEAAPQAMPQRSWALINLLSVIVSILTALMMVISFFRHKDENEENEEENEENDDPKGRNKLLGIIPALIATIAFILTEDMRNPMALIDRYTIMMLIIMLSNLVLAYITRNRRKEDEEEQDLKLHEA